MPNPLNVSPSLIQAYQDEIARQGSPATARRKTASLKKFFSWAADEGLVGQNPFPQVAAVEPSEETTIITASKPKSKVAVNVIRFATLGALIILLLLLTTRIKFSIPFRLPFAQVITQEGIITSVTPSASPSPQAQTGTTTVISFEEKDPFLAKIYKNGVLTLESLAPAIKSIGNLLIESKSITLSTSTASDGDITINPDGAGKAKFIFEGTSGNQLSAQSANLSSGALIYGSVTNNSSGYDLLELQSGSSPVTRFSVDALGNTRTSGNLEVDQDLNLYGDLNVGGVTRLNSAGRLTSITGYYQDSGLFKISEGAPDSAEITKSGVTASADVLTLTLDETGKTASNRDTLVLSRLNPTTGGYALYVDNGNVKLDGQLFLGNYSSDPQGAEEGSIYYNTTSDKIRYNSATGWADIDTGGSGGDLWTSASGVIYPATITNNLALGTTSSLGAQFSQIIDSATEIGQVIRAASSQTANLTEWQDSSGTVLANISSLGGAVFNESGADTDFRVEGDTDANLLFADASADAVGIGDSTPDAKLEILSTGEQLRLTNTDNTYDAKFTVNNSGNLTINPTASLTVTTDGTGDAEVVLPNSSIGPNEVMATGQVDELCLTYEASGTTWEWQTCGSGGAGTWDTIGDPLGNGSIAMTQTTQTLDWNMASDAALDALTLTLTNDVAGSNIQNLLSLVNVDDAGANGVTEALLVLSNLDTNEAVTTALKIISEAGGITTAIDVSDAEITTALSTGENNLSGTNWSLTGSSGNFSTAGVGQFGYNTPTTFSRFGSASSGHSLSTADDVLIGSDLELNGILYLDGLNIANAIGTSTIVFSDTPTTTANSLSAGNWLVENTANLGQAALMVKQTKAGDLFTASASSTPKFTIQNSGQIWTAPGTFLSNVANGGSAIGYTFNTANTLTTTAKVASFQNNSTELFYIDSSGNVWAKGSFYADRGFGIFMRNIGTALSQYDLVVINTTENASDGVPRMTATTSAYAKNTYGVVQEACANAATCKVVVQGKSLINVADSTSRGDYLFSSATSGQATSATKQYDGMLGIATSDDASAPYQVEMVFLNQPAVSKLRVADKNRMHNDYRDAAASYDAIDETSRYLDSDENVRKGLYFDTFKDSIKTDTANLSAAIDNQKQRAGLAGGVTLNATNTDTSGSTYLGGADANDVYYYDRSQTGAKNSNQDSSIPTLVDLGIDPNWYNGVTLVNATSSGTLAPNPPANLSPSYNGSLIKVSGRYTAGQEDGGILVTILSDNEATASANPSVTFSWKTLDNPNSPSHSGSSVITNKGVAYTLETGTNDITVTFSHTRYHAGDLFEIASWRLEPETSNDRGEKAEFPQRAYIIAGNSNVDILDADTNKLWMRFSQGTDYALGVDTNNDPSSVQMLNGKLYVGTNGAAATGMYEIDFATNTMYRFNSTARFTHTSPKGIADRNTDPGDAYHNNVSTSSQTIIDATVNDVSATVVPNQPTQEVTVRGWGYIYGSAATAIGETVYFPYKFTTAPKLVVSTHAAVLTAPTRLEDCGSGDTDYGMAYNLTATQFTMQMTRWNAGNLSTYYYCYGWEATGTLVPQTLSAVATDTGVTVINETNSSATDYSGGASNDYNQVSLTSTGQLYTTNETLAQLEKWYGVSANTTDRTAATPDKIWDDSATNYPSIAGTTATINASAPDSLEVTEGTSTIDNFSPTIYLTTNQGLAVIQDYDTNSNQGDGGSESRGSVKYYTKDYISEDMYGDIRGMWPLNAANATSDLEDVSVKANVLTATNITSADSVSGVRTDATDFDGSTEYLSCTDANCGGTADLDVTTSVTYGAWIKTTDTVGAIMSKVNWGVAGIFSFGVGDTYQGTTSYNGKLVFVGGDGIKHASNRVINDGQWHFVTATKVSASTIKLYIDGQLEYSNTTANALIDVAQDFYIGANLNSNVVSNYFAGIIDEPFVTAGALTDTQIKRIYETGKRALQSHTINDYKNNLDENGTGTGTATNPGNNVLAVGVQQTSATPGFGPYAFVALNNTGSADDGYVNKIDLNSDTVVQWMQTTTDPALPDNDITTLSTSPSGLEIVGADGIGASSPGLTAQGNDSSGTYYSDVISLPDNISSAYLWVNQWLDSDCADCSIAVSASNDGSSNYVSGVLMNTDTNQSLPEKEYFFSFNSAGNSLKVKFVFTRDASLDANLYIEKWGITWFNDDDTYGGNNGGLFTNTGATVANGSYVEVSHNQNTNDIVATGWYYDSKTGLWKDVATATESGVISGSNAALAHEGTLTVTHNLNTYDALATGWEYSNNTEFRQINEPQGANHVATDANLVGWWKMEEASGDLTDQSALANTLIDKGTPAYAAAGKVDGGDAVTFNGSTDYFCTGSGTTCADDNDFDIGTSDWTMGAWVKTNAFGTFQSIFNKNGSGGDHYYLGIDSNNKAQVEFRDAASNNLTATGISTLTDGNWHFIVGVKAGTKTHLYVDGRLESTGTNPSLGSMGNTSALFLGALSTPANYFNGQMDEPFVYSNDLTEEQIQALYQYGTKRYKIANPTLNTSTLNNLSGATQNVRLDVATRAYRIQQVNANTVRLYNYSGSTQNLRLDVVAGSVAQDTNTVSLAPVTADVVSDDSRSSIWVNTTGEGGNSLRLQDDGTDVFKVTTEGNTTIGASTTNDVDVTLYGDIFQQGNTDLTALTNIKDVFVYDTTKDSDAGDWTNNATAQQLSWYTETKDDGQGDACVVGTDDRCGRSAFPKKAIIVVTSSSVKIFDAQNNLLWMDFTQAGTYALGASTNNSPSSVYARNGSVYVGMNGSASLGLIEIDFRKDRILTYDTTDQSQADKNIANRNTTVTYNTNNNTSLAIANNAVNDVHATTVDGRDLIATANDMGLSVIDRSANQVRTYSRSDSDDYNSVWLTPSGNLYGLDETSSELHRYNTVHLDTGSRRSVEPDRLWGRYGAPSLTAGAPTIQASTPSDLFVSPHTSTQNGSSDAIYVGTDQGLSTIQDGPIGTASQGTYSTTGQGQIPASCANGFATAFIGGTNYLYGIGLGGCGTASSAVYKATIDSSGNVGTWATTSQSQFTGINLTYPNAIALSINGSNYIYEIANSTAPVSAVYKATIDASGNVGSWSTVSQGQLTAATQAPGIAYANANGSHYLYAQLGASAIYKATIDSSGNIGSWDTTSQGQLSTDQTDSAIVTLNVRGKNYIYTMGGNGGFTSVVYKATIDSSGNVGTWSTLGQAQLPAAGGYARRTGFTLNVGGAQYICSEQYTNAYVHCGIVDDQGNVRSWTSTASGASSAYTGYQKVNQGGQQYVYRMGGWSGAGTTVVHKSTINSGSGSVKYANQSYITEEMPGDVRGMWPFSETSGSLLDASWHASYLEDEIAPTYSASGVRGSALTFNGTSQHLCSDANNDGTCDNDSDFDFGTGSFAVSTWFKHAAAIAGTDILVDHYYNTTPAAVAGWQIYMNSSGQMVFAIDDDAALGPDDSIISANDYSDNQWHHLTAVKNGTSSIALYIDGVKVAEKVGLTATETLSGSGVIMGVGSDCGTGAACATGTNFWDGSIDELMLTAENLSPSQIKSLYQDGRVALKYRTIPAVADATTYSSTTIGDSGESWTPNEFVGAFVEIYGGTGVGQTRKIVSNTATALTVSPAFTTTPDATSDFQIHPHELYGGTNTVTAVTATDAVPGQTRYLYVGTSDGSDGGGVTKLRLDGGYVTDVYHGNAGRSDDGSTAWGTTTGYDNISALSYSSDTLVIGSAAQYWSEYTSKSFTQKIDELTNRINQLALTSAGSGLTDQHRQDDTTNSQANYQVIRKGWGWIVGDATVEIEEQVNYGITFNDTPIIIAGLADSKLNAAPTDLSECNSDPTSTLAIGLGTINVTRSGFEVDMNMSDGGVFGSTTYFCYTWLAIGTFQQGASYPWAGGADLAEWYATNDPTLKAGETVSIDKSGTVRVVRSSQAYDASAIGIVATQPALTLGPESGLTPGYNEEQTASSAKSVAVALAGRVPVKVSLEGGPIAAGDPLTTSSTPGVAMKATQAGPTIGKALESFDGTATIVTFAGKDVPTDNFLAENPNATESATPMVLEKEAFADLNQGIGTIMAFVNNSWYDLTDSGDFKIVKTGLASTITPEPSSSFSLVDQGNKIVDRVGKFSDFIAANIRAGYIQSSEVVAGGLKASRAAIDQLTSNNIITKTIQPPEGENLTIDLEHNKSATQSAFGKLLVRGNASVSGTLASQNLKVEKDATVSGTLYADRIVTREPVKTASAVSLAEIEAMLKEAEGDQKLLAKTNDWTVNTATDSANLDQQFKSLALRQLFVTDTAAINALSLSSSLSLGTDLVIQSDSLTASSINTLTHPLQIQSLGLAPIELMAGLIKIDTSGNVEIGGDLYVAGKIESPLGSFKDLSTEHLIIAKSEATVSATLEGLVTETNATAGKSLIPSGVTDVIIKNPRITDYTLIYVTPTSTTENKVLYVKSKETGKFVVGFDEPLENDVEFNWWIIDISQ